MEDGKEMIKVIYEDNHLLVIEKPVNMPVQQDQSNDVDVLTSCKQYLKEKYNKPGNVYLGLVHRLDRPVGGVMVFAKTSKAASRLSDTIRKNQMHKQYLAIIDGQTKQSDHLEDYLLKDKKTNMVTVSKDGQLSKLDYELITSKDKHSLVLVNLITGRPHQIRVQFYSRGLPLVNDQRYHPNPDKGQIALWSYKLTFTHPTTKEEMTFTSLPLHVSPWDEFDKTVYNI